VGYLLIERNEAFSLGRCFLARDEDLDYGKLQRVLSGRCTSDVVEREDYGLLKYEIS